MMSSGIFLLCNDMFFFCRWLHLLFGVFSVGLAFSVFNLFSYGFGVWDLVFVSLFLCHWVNETLFVLFVLVSLPVSACISFVLFLKSGSLGCIFFLPLSQQITVQVHLISFSLPSIFFFTFESR